MSRFSIEIVVKVDHLTPLARGGLMNLLDQVLRKSAHDVERFAKEVVPVDTGVTKNSIMVKPVGPLSFSVGPSTDYAIFLELGTHNRPARPFMVPALERVRPGLEAAVKQAVEKAAS